MNQGDEPKEVCNGGVACRLAPDKPRPLLKNSLDEPSLHPLASN